MPAAQTARTAGQSSAAIGRIVGSATHPSSPRGFHVEPAGHRREVTTLTLHATGPVDPAEAWDRYAFPARWSSWAPQITGVSTDALRVTPGVAGGGRGPGGVGVPFVLDEGGDAARGGRWTGRAGGVRLRLLHWVSPGREGGTTTALRVRGPLPVVTAYAPAALLALHGLVRR